MKALRTVSALVLAFGVSAAIACGGDNDHNHEVAWEDRRAEELNDAEWNRLCDDLTEEHVALYASEAEAAARLCLFTEVEVWMCFQLEQDPSRASWLLELCQQNVDECAAESPRICGEALENACTLTVGETMACNVLLAEATRQIAIEIPTCPDLTEAWLVSHCGESVQLPLCLNDFIDCTT
jgi:hypothetical protein